MKIKAEIDALCKDLLMSNVSEYISVPVVLMVYLGEKTYNVVNASLKDAFTTSFKVEPDVYDIRIDDSQVTSEKIVEDMVAAIRSVNEQGRNFDDLRITFVTLMDDSLYASECIGLAATIRDALGRLSSFGIGTNKVSLYGIFQQRELQTNYVNAFKFVNEGKNIWKNIYHMETLIFDMDIHKYTKLIAINNMCDEYMMTQNAEDDEYQWKSILLHYLKVPELIVAKVLRKIYANQISGQNLDLEEWEENVGAELESVFSQLFTKEEHRCEQYIPLCYYEEREPETKKSGFLGGLFGRKEQDLQPEYTNIIFDENSIVQLLDELYGSIQLGEADYHSIMEGIISSASAIDNNHNNISQSVRRFLNKKATELEQQLENRRSREKFQEDDKYNATAHIQNVYGQKKGNLILEKKIELTKALVEQVSNGRFLSQLIQDICMKNREYTDALDRLSKNEYGGTLEHENVNMAVLPNFKVNQSVREVLSGIGMDTLNQIINDEDTIYNNLIQFLNHTMTNTTGVSNRHSLGEVNGTYNTLEPVNSALLLTPAQENEERMQTLLKNFPGIYTKSNSMYRENTFYMISSRIYSSDRYIVRYKRG